MDCVKWKLILLQWAKATDLLENSEIGHLEEANIRVFFEGFRQKIKIAEESVGVFIEEHFPDCSIKFNDAGGTSPPNIMYIFSLFLYYSCVKNADQFFQGCCNQLDAKHQLVIANFFRQLVDQSSLTKEVIRNAIQQAIPLMVPPFISIDSPIKTPRSKQTPPTPTTLLLNEKKREIKLLQSQLDSERYDRGYLEVQQKQNEEKIEKLIRDHKKQMQEIQSLKAELLNRNEENMSPNRAFKDEQNKKRLRKQIVALEEELQKTQLALETALDDSKHVKEKLVYSEKHVKELMGKTKELEEENDELRHMVNAKTGMINSMLENQMELESCLRELRKGNVTKNQNSSSIECLDVSFSASNNTSSNVTGSPENLGRAVVDLMLRENQNKVRDLEIEICQLQEQMAEVEKNKCSLHRENEELVEKFTAEKEKLSNTVAELEAEVSELSTSKTKAVYELKGKIADLEVCRLELESEMKANDERAKDEVLRLQTSIQENSTKHENILVSIEAKNSEISDLQTKIGVLNAEVLELTNSLVSAGKKSESLGAENQELQSQLEFLENEKSTIQVQLEIAELQVKELTVKVQAISSGHLAVTEELANKTEEARALEVEIHELKKQLDEQEAACKVHIGAFERLQVDFARLTSEFNGLQTERKAVQEELKQMGELNESQTAVCGEQTAEIEKLRQQLDVKVESEKGLDEIIKHLSEKSEKEQDQILNLKQSLEAAQDCSAEMQRQVEQKGAEIQILQSKLSDIETELSSKNKEISKLRQQLEAKEESESGLGEAIKQLREKSKQDQDQINNLKQSSDAAKHEWAVEMKRQAEQTGGEIKILQTKLSDIESELSSKNEELNKLRQQLEAKEESEIGLAETIKQLRQKSEQDQDQIKNLRQSSDAAKQDWSVEIKRQVQEKEAEIQTLQTKLSDIETEIESQAAVCAQQTEEINTLRQQVDLKEKNVDVLEETVKQLREKSKLDQGQIRNLKQTSDIAKQDWSAEMQRQVEQKESEIQVLQTKLSGFETELSSKKSSLDELSEKFEKLTAETNDQVQLLASKEKECKQLEDSLAQSQQRLEQQTEAHNLEIAALVKSRLAAEEEFRTQLTTAVKFADELQTELDQKSATAKDLEEAQQETSELLNEYMEKLNEIEAINAVLKSSATEQEEQRRVVEDKLSEELENLREQREANLALKNEMDKLRDAFESVKSELLVVQKESEVSKVAQTELVAELTDVKSHSSANVDQLLADKKQIEEVVEQLNQNAAAKDVEIIQLKGFISGFDSVLESILKEETVTRLPDIDAEDLNTITASMLRHIEEIAARHAELKNNTNQAEAVNHEAQQASIALESELSEARAELETLKEETRNLKATVEETSSELQTIQGECKRLIVEYSASSESLAESELAKAALQTLIETEITKFNKERERFVSQQQEQEHKIQELVTKVTDLTEQHLQKSEEVSELNAQLVERTTEVAQLKKKCEDVIAEQQAKVEGQVEVHTNERQNLLDQNQAYMQKIQELIAEKETMENEIYEIEREIVTKNDTMCEKMIASTRPPPLSEKLNTIKQQVHNLNLEKSKFIDSITDLDRKLESASNENYKLQDKCAQLQESFEEATQMRQDYDQKVERLERMLADSETNFELLKQGAEKTESLVAKLKAEVLAASQLKAEHETLKIEHNRIDLEKKALANQLVEADLAISVHKERIVRLEALVENADRSTTTEMSRIHELSKQLELLKLDGKHVDELEQLHKQEKELNAKLQTDVAIFQAKLTKERQMVEKKEKEFADERKALQERVAEAERLSVAQQKDVRLDMEVKLEKMKERMKTLYNEELGKAKGKFEIEITELRNETQGAINKAQKYEMQAEKMSQQMLQLEHINLDLKRQYEHAKTKLNFLETNSKMGSNASVNRMLPPTTTASASLAPHVPMGSNLRMEDEEGECFNNTYLTDLKTGRMSTFGDRESMRLSELQSRNSMQPAHLRSAYAAQYFEQDNEDVIKNGALNDDSLSSLLPTGTRKKLGGTTSYKRPGPPTPSKNAGRLSIGGGDNQPQYREVLKEPNTERNGKKSTPTRKSFLSRLSIANKTDENNSPKRRMNIFRTKRS